jgi:hypothetical protein
VDGRFGAHPGARDAAPPRDDRCVRFSHRLYFALTKTRWGEGGVAFVECHPESVDTTIGRAYLITAAQFIDVAAQENRDPRLRRDGFVVPSTADQVALDTHGRYNRVIGLESLDGIPAVTLTTGRALERNPPGAAYLDVMRAGLAECSIRSRDIDAYFEDVLRES